MESLIQLHFRCEFDFENFFNIWAKDILISNAYLINFNEDNC